MTDDLKRFLAVNGLFNGRKLTDVVDGDYAEMDRLLGSSRSKELEEILENKPDVMINVHPVLRSLINYFRTYQYAFVTPQGAEPIKFSSIMESDREGTLPDQLRMAVLSQFIQQAEQVKEEKDVGVFDGCLRYTPDIEFSKIPQMVVSAYYLVMYGPTGAASDRVMKYSKYFTLAGFKSFSGAQALNVVNALASADYQPRTYALTNIIVPDLLKVYKETGLVMRQSEIKDNAVDWAIDYPREGQKTKTVVVTVEHAMLRTLIVNSLQDLHSIVHGGPSNPLVVKG